MKSRAKFGTSGRQQIKRDVLNTLAVKAPGFGDRRKEMLEDIAILTGGTVISEDTGRNLRALQLKIEGGRTKFGQIKKTPELLAAKATAALKSQSGIRLKTAMEQSTSDFDKEKLHERLAKLSGGVAVINVGAATEVEMKEKKERVIDAVAATKAALEEGIVPGGGVTLLKARAVLDKISQNFKNQR